jgi:Mg-chelatase subunit ChlD
VRQLSRTLYESDPEQWKENLNRATLSVGDATIGTKAWRITVTDPRGGRGTDYRVADSDVDAQGGLLLIPTIVPTSRRDWTQYLGRTARQDRRGQFCCVLNAADYKALSDKYSTPLSTDGSMAAVETVLKWGDLEAAARIRDSAALYHTGVRVNELCEEVFAKRPDLLKDSSSRERLVDICQRHRWMSVREVTDAFDRLPGLNAATLPTEATDMGRPQEPPAQRVRNVQEQESPAKAPSGGPPTVVSNAAKAVVFCLDWSASMMSRDTRTPLSRFEMCVQNVQRILRDQVRDCDFVSVVGFGPNVQTVVPPVAKGRGGQQLDAHIAALRPQAAGGTCFYDAVATSLQILNQPGLVPTEGMRWLVCLTDGDDLGSQRGNQNGEMVTQMLHTSPPANLNIVMITVGPMKEQNLKIMDTWVERVTKSGGQGTRISEKDAVNITKAFEVVAEYLAADVGGAVEC